MRDRILTLVLFFLSHILFAQRGYSKRSYEIIGLSSGSEIADSLMIAIPLLLLASLIIYASTRNKREESNSSPFIGFIVLGMIGVGIFFLIPLFTWVEFIFVNIVTIGIAIAVIFFILYVIYSALKR